ncbi:MAG: N-acyl-D-amino-acid deacylase family protein [Chitinophagales bacterium]
MNKTTYFTLFLSIFLLYACSNSSTEIDTLIKGGTIVDGTGNTSYTGDIGLKGNEIVFVGNADNSDIKAKQTIEAKGMVVSPGFIDPHTHSLSDLQGDSNNSNLNYLTQGVTTVMNGNDGGGPTDIAAKEQLLLKNGIGTNTAFLVGHNTIREAVLESKDVAPDSLQLEEMKALVRKGMKTGAFGFSTGLYYVPGFYAETEEVIALAKEAAPFGGLYESHIRDESTYNIGLIESVKETIEIGEKAGVPIHFAHIKALGVDVWGKSGEVIALIEAAQKRGIKITADQYPWIASGTHLENALINRWVMEGGEEKYQERLNDPKLLPKIRIEIIENLRKRGGANSILITADCKDESMIGFNLKEISEKLQRDSIQLVLDIARNGGARIASFNMNPKDLENFMQQDWVMTSSDGTKGHPRKFGTFPKKFQDYVMLKKLLTMESYIRKCTGQVAATFGIVKRGLLQKGYYADVVVFSPKNFKSIANFSQPSELSEGVQYLWVNGELTIEGGKYTGKLAGQVLKKNTIE